VPDEALQPAAQAHLVVREVHTDSGIRKCDEPYLIEWSEAIEKRGRGIENRAERPRADAHLIDRDDNPSPGWRRQVAGVEAWAFRLVNAWLSPVLDIDLDEIRGNHTPRGSVDLDDEIRREKVVHRLSVSINDRDIDGHQIDTRTESWALDRSLLGRDQRERGDGAQGDAK
jgi:hypothetical protein